MPKITYYALIDETHPLENPTGIMRRIHTSPVATDEVFARDLQWRSTEFLRLHWLGHNEEDYVEIIEEQAEAVVFEWRQRLRED
jgi:hypothetical protein